MLLRIRVVEDRQNLVEGRYIAAQTTILKATFDQLTVLLMRNITFLYIFATLPVSTATSERLFSALKLIKTYLRTSMQENRLNALTLLYINNGITPDYSQVIDHFAKGNRRLNLKYTDFVLCLIFILRFHSFNRSRKSIILKLVSRMHENA